MNRPSEHIDEKEHEHNRHSNDRYDRIDASGRVSQDATGHLDRIAHGVADLQ